MPTFTGLSPSLHEHAPPLHEHAPPLPEQAPSPPAIASSPPSIASSRSAWRWVVTALRIGLGAVAVVAGGIKASDLATSVRAVRAYQLLPDSLAVLAGNVLPFVEVALGALLVIGLFTRWSALAFALLLVAFCIGIGSAWARGLTIDCGCFGGGGLTDADKTTYLVDLLRDAGLIAVAAVLVWRPSSRLSFDSALARLSFDSALDPSI